MSSLAGAVASGSGDAVTRPQTGAISTTPSRSSGRARTALHRVRADCRCTCGSSDRSNIHLARAPARLIARAPSGRATERPPPGITARAIVAPIAAADSALFVGEVRDEQPPRGHRGHVRASARRRQAARGWRRGIRMHRAAGLQSRRPLARPGAARLDLASAVAAVAAHALWRSSQVSPPSIRPLPQVRRRCDVKRVRPFRDAGRCRRRARSR